MAATVNINAVCDYVITRVLAADERLSALKLQKLLYYVQAWHLAFFGAPLFDGKFQAWVHGPVNREIYNRLSPDKSLYSDLTMRDVSLQFEPSTIPCDAREHIDSILEAYAQFSGTQLESFTHNEEPWIAARKGYRPSERCTVEIDEGLMATFYRSR
jgi:uncharacterized phage-associated protein